LRLLIYGLNYDPEPTGIGKYSGEMGAWLAGRGHTVDAIVAPPYYPQWEVLPGYSNEGFTSENISGVRVHRAPLFVPPAGGVSALKRIVHETSFSATSSRYWLPRLLQKRRYDAVIAVCQPVQIGVYPWIYRRLRGVPFVFHVQDLQVDVAVRLGMLKNARMARALYKIENAMLKAATRVSTITETMRRRVVEKGVPEHKTWLFPNWSDVEFVRPLPRDNEVRREFGAGPEDVLVLYAGNMGEKQGLDLVLDAADELRERPKLKFAMVGSGAARERLERSTLQRRLSNVRFFPLQPLERLPHMLAAGDIHLVVQRREAADLVMPSKLTNILAAGRPSVATADPGTTLYDVLNDHRCGVTTAPGDVKGLVAGIVGLLENDKERELLGRNARRYAESYLSRDQILAQFESRLQSLAQQ
jgi:colanic acid biosynthesis glycosyl transferase WcaI